MKITLSPIDRLFLYSNAYPIEMSFFFERPLDAEFLKRGLSVLLEEWSPLRGRVHIEGQEAWIEDSDPHSISLVVSENAPKVLPDDASAFGNLCTGIETDAGKPLVHFKLFQQGSHSWLTVAMAHCLGDGYSYFLMLRNLAAACQGETIADVHWDRSALFAPDSPGWDPKAFSLPVEQGLPRSRFLQSPLSWELAHWSREETKVLLESVQATAPSRISLHDCLCAVQWQKAVRAKNTGASTVRLNTPVDVRRFMQQELGPFFFGNGIFCASAVATQNEMLEATVGDLAAKVRKAIREVSAENVLNQSRLMQHYQREQGLESVARWNMFQEHSPVLVTNLSALPLHELRFGVDEQAPSQVRYVGAFPGLSVVLPTAPGETSMQSFKC